MGLGIVTLQRASRRPPSRTTARYDLVGNRRSVASSSTTTWNLVREHVEQHHVETHGESMAHTCTRNRHNIRLETAATLWVKLGCTRKELARHFLQSSHNYSNATHDLPKASTLFSGWGAIDQPLRRRPSRRTESNWNIIRLHLSNSTH